LNAKKNIQPQHSSSDHELEHLNIGSRIRSIRGDRSQEEYSSQLKIGISTLRRYEGNARSPDATALIAIYEVDGVLSDWILRGEPPMRKGDELEPNASKAVDYDLIQIVVEAVEEILIEANRELTPTKKGQLICAVLDLYSDLYSTSETKPEKNKVLRLVQLAA